MQQLPVVACTVNINWLCQQTLRSWIQRLLLQLPAVHDLFKLKCKRKETSSRNNDSVAVKLRELGISRLLVCHTLYSEHLCTSNLHLKAAQSH